MSILDDKKQIYSVTATKDEIFGYASLGYRSAITPTSESEEKVVKQALAGAKLPPAAPPADFLNKQSSLKEQVQKLDSSERKIYYAFFGDIIQAFMQKVKESMEKTKKLIADSDTPEGKNKLKQEDMGGFLKKTQDEKEKITKTIDDYIKKLPTFKILLADFNYKHYTGTSESKEEIRRLNIADIPISLDVYNKFMYDKVVNSDRNTFVISQFLESCLEKGGLLDKALAQWAEAKIAPNVISAIPSFTSNTFSGPQLRSSVFGGGNLTTTQVPSPQKSISANQVDDECDYFLIYQSPTAELTKGKSGRKADNIKRGVYHFEVGKNTGLFKNISFSRIDVPFVQEQLMTNQVGMYDELKMVYNANIEMVGNNLFFPGSEIYVDPASIGFGNPRNVNSAAFRLGLGGYYTVVGVSTSVQNGVASTSLTCTHLAHPTDRVDDVLADDPIAKSGQIPPAKNQDSIPQSQPELGTQKTKTKIQYQSSLSSLVDENNNHVLDQKTSENIAKDFVTDSSERAPFEGLSSRQINEKTGVVIYHLSNGISIKIDPRTRQESVSLIKNSSTVPKRR